MHSLREKRGERECEVCEGRWGARTTNKGGKCGWVGAQNGPDDAGRRQVMAAEGRKGGPDDAGKRQSNGCRRSQRGARTTQEKEKVPGRDCQGREGAQATRRGDGGMALLLELLRATDRNSPVVYPRAAR